MKLLPLVLAPAVALLAATTTAQREIVKPPLDPARKLTNLDFEEKVEGGAIPGWMGGGEGYERAVDTDAPHGGKQCARIRRLPDAKADAFFAAMTSCVAAAPFHGKRVRLSGWLRSADVAVTSGLWMRVDGPDGALTWDNMRDRPVTGTTPWRRFEVVLDVEDKATGLCLGVMLQGAGTVWADDLALDVVGTDVRATAMVGGRLPGGGAGLFELRGEYAVTAVDGGKPRHDPHMLMPVPLCYREQVPISYELTVDPPTAARSLRVYEDQPGNFVADVTLAPPPAAGEVALRWRAIVLCRPRAFADVPKSAPLPETWPEDVRPWLSSTRFVQASDERIQAVAKRARGESRDVMAILNATIREARAIKDQQKGQGKDLGAVEALSHQGSCTSCANLLAALIRASGIPARILAGYPTWSGPLQTHYIVEAAVPGYGWDPIESTMLMAPWDPCGQLQVAIMTKEYEDKGGERFPNAPGVPWLSLTEHPHHDGSYFALGAVDRKRSCDHVATQWKAFASSTDEAQWQSVTGTARARWQSWLAGKPESGAGGGRLATACRAEQLADVLSTAALARVLAVGAPAVPGAASRTAR